MEVVDYENTTEIPLNVADDNNAWASNNSSVPWVNTPMIDAKVGVYNMPNPPDPTADLVWWSTDLVWSATDSDTVAWTSGTITLSWGTEYTIDAGNTGDISAITYIYLDTNVSLTVLQKTTTSSSSVWGGKILVCVAKNETSPKLATFQAFGTLGQWVLITADNIAANVITANEIHWNTITSAQIAAWGVNADRITSSSFVLSAGTFTSNSPTAWRAAYSWCKVVYKGTTYDITNWDTDKKFIYWKLSAPTVFTTYTTIPAWWADEFLVATNTSWTYQIAWNSTMIDGNRIYTSSLAAITATLGSVSAGSMSWVTMAIGTDNSIFKADANGIYLGNATFASAPFSVDMSWNLKATSATISWALTAGSGSSLPTTYLSGNIWLGNTDVSAMWWTQTCAFSSSDTDTVAWWSWTLTTAAGTSYSISAGNTGNMGASTTYYIYFSTASDTVYLTTTTATTAIWAGKVLIGVAQAAVAPATSCTFQVFGGKGWVLVGANQIAANSITANEINSSYVYAWEIDADNITSGTITWRTLQTGTSWQRVVISSSDNRIQFYNSNDDDCWYLSWSYNATYWDVISSSWIFVSWSHFLCWWRYLGDIEPYSSASNDLWSASYQRRDLYVSWTIDFDDWDWVLSEVSWRPRRSSNGGTAYNLLVLAGSSTNKTTNASIIVQIGTNQYYINVLPV